MNRRRALGASLATLALASTLIACGSQTPGSVDLPQPPAKVSCAPNDNDYSWCSNQPGASAPAGGTDKKTSEPLPTITGPIRWGDYHFGDCGLNLYPASHGLTITNHQVVVLAGTFCIGYQPQEVNIHIHVQRWYSLGLNAAGLPNAPKWHDEWVLVDATKPPIVLVPPDGEVPLAEQHQIKGAQHCIKTSPAGQPSLYQLEIDILGVSYGGHPIVTGGISAPLIVPWSLC